MLNDPFDVRLTRQAEKDIRDLRPWADRILRTLQSLKQDPQRGHALRGSLAGVRSLEFSLPGGAHRAIYVMLDDDRVFLVFLVGAHEGIYERAERRVEALRRQGTIWRSRVRMGLDSDSVQGLARRSLASSMKTRAASNWWRHSRETSLRRRV